MTAKDKNARKVFIQDQYDAAVEQVDNVMDVLGIVFNKQKSKSEQFFLDTYYGQKYRYLKERAPKFCVHCDPKLPKPYYSLLARPDVLWCINCIIVEAQKRAIEYPSTCDACDTDGHTIFSETVAQFGNIIINANVCLPCREKHSKSMK